MHVLVAPNSFKNCLDAGAVAQAMARGICAACPMATVTCLPLADGGDGPCQPCLFANSETREVVVGPVGPSGGSRLVVPGDLAIIEMAQASGLHRLRADEYAPLCATTAGSGLLIKAARDAGCRRVVIGLGGSATVDGGAGMLSALGFGLLDKPWTPDCARWRRFAALANIIVETADARLSAAQFIGLADVDNPLLGPTGAARVRSQRRRPGGDRSFGVWFAKLPRCWSGYLVFGRMTCRAPGRLAVWARPVWRP